MSSTVNISTGAADEDEFSDYDSDELEYKTDDEKKQNKTTKKENHRSQKYRREWEHQAAFKSWITKVPNNEFAAKCTICNCILKSEISVLKSHGKTMKHKNKLSGKSFNVKIFSKMYGTVFILFQDYQ